MKARYKEIAPLPAAVFIIAAVGLSVSGSADELMPRPGNYEVVTSSNFGGVPVTQTLTSCITAEQLAQDPQKVFAEVPAADNCELEKFEMANGQLSMRMSCNAEDGSILMTTEGSYEPERYMMNTRITINAGDTEVATDATVSGVRIGDC